MSDDSRVSPSEIIRVKNEIRSDLNRAEEKLLIDLPKQMSESMELANTQALGLYVSYWIKHGQNDALINYLRTAIYEQKIEKMSQFGNNLKKLGVDLAVDKQDDCDSGCKWVPSAFSQLDGRHAYGGVFVRPQLNIQNERGFEGFQARSKNAGSSANSARGASSGSNRGGSSSSSSGGGGRGGGSPPPPKISFKKMKSKDEVHEKYGHGKGWPKINEVFKVGDYNWFAKPGTCKSFCQCFKTIFSHHFFS